MMNNSLWKVFYLMSIGSVTLLVVILYFNYKSIDERNHTQIQHYTEIIANSVNSGFLQEEMVLNVVGEHFFNNDEYKKEKEVKKLFDRLLLQNPSLLSLGLANEDGEVFITSSNIKRKKNLNLLKNKKTAYGFKNAINSKTMIIGRTYYFLPLKEWIIPLRKSIFDDNGKLLGVVVASIKSSENSNYLDTIKLSKENFVTIVKDFDDESNAYLLYYNQKGVSSKELYGIPVLDNHSMDIEKEIMSKYHLSLDNLRKNKQSVSVEMFDMFDENMITGIIYDSRYKLWISVKVNSSKVWDEFNKILLIDISLFMISYLVVFLLFRTIATSEEKKKKELVSQALIDTLTKLPNRTYMYKNIKRWKSIHKENFNVLYLDLDNFKNINDKFGHTVGDKILVEVAHRLVEYFDEGDMLIRQGGDEFIVLLENLGEDESESKIEKLIELISEVYFIDNREFRIGVSVGISQSPRDATRIEALLSFADTAMYEAKKRKNSYCYFSEKMRSNNIIKSDIEHELRGAVKKDELRMVYQPQINSDGTLYGVEALVRWENKKLGFVGPDKFIPVAEQTGLMRELGDFITRTSLRDINTIKAQLGVDFCLSINISVMQIIEADFLENILNILNDEDFDIKYLTLEITESLSIEDLDEVLPILNAVREAGIEISLDDFGTGYSSLSILRDLPINELKIDKSFIDKILYDESEKVLIRSIINIGKNFKMRTLAEGVESYDQIQVLQSFNCDIFQGFYYSKPLSVENLIKFIKKEKK
ncbi:MAG: diguanylate cyclase (GGDEF)-like protein [Sulfurimonas sp.]|jgi:diguanylate cyclase (GGDEF)-like protein